MRRASPRTVHGVQIRRSGSASGFFPEHVSIFNGRVSGLLFAGTAYREPRLRGYRNFVSSAFGALRAVRVKDRLQDSAV